MNYNQFFIHFGIRMQYENPSYCERFSPQKSIIIDFFTFFLHEVCSTTRVEIPLKNRSRFERFEWFSSKI